MSKLNNNNQTNSMSQTANTSVNRRSKIWTVCVECSRLLQILSA